MLRFAIISLLLAILRFTEAGQLLRNSTSGETFCNTSEGYLFPSGFDGELCGWDFEVLANATVMLDNSAGFVLPRNDTVSIERIGNATLMGIFGSSEYGYTFCDNHGTSVQLLDLNNSLAGRSAWDWSRSSYWAVGYSAAGTQAKFYRVDVANNFSTSFYFISTGEIPVDLYWNGTEIVGIVQRNFTYFTVAFMLNNRRTVLGPVNGNYINIDKQKRVVTLIPLQEDWTYLCERNCTLSYPIVYSSMKTEVQTTGTFPSFSYNNTTAQFGTTTERFATPSQFNIEITITPIQVGVTIGDRVIDIPGRLVIQSGATLTLDLSGADLSVGDIVTIYNFAQLEGSFAELNLQSTDSCQHYEGQLVYSDRSLGVVITASENFCTNMANLFAVKFLL